MKSLLAFLLLAGIAHGELLFIYGDGCPPCERMKPIVAQLQRDGLSINAVNASRQQVPAYDGHGVPQFVVTDDGGRVVRRSVGATGYAELRAFYGQANKFNFVYATPHPSVCVVANKSGNVSYNGSGTLVDADCVITVAHIFTEGTGNVSVAFPGRRPVQARVIGIDKKHDLAALEITPIDLVPVVIAANKPQIGDVVKSSGYGGEGYAVNTGKVVQYVAMGTDMPWEVLEISGPARQGDSGGPMLNDRGELVAVVAGTNEQVTVGTCCTIIDNCLNRWRGRRMARWQSRQPQRPPSQSRPPQSQMPIVRPPAQQPPQQDRSCNCGPCEIDYDKLADRLASDARFRPIKGDRGEDCEIDYDRLAKAVAARMTPQEQDVDVLVAEVLKRLPPQVAYFEIKPRKR